MTHKLKWETKGSDGTFWVTMNDFIKYFDVVSIALVEPNWSWSSCEFSLTGSWAIFNLSTTTDACNLFLTLHQKRGKPLIGVRLCVLSASTSFGGTSDSFGRLEALSSKQINLPTKGIYNVVVEVHSESHSLLPAPFSISCYSSSLCSVILSSVGTLNTKSPIPFELPEFIQKYGQCTSCGKSLLGSICTVNGKKYHPDCFICSMCNEKLISGQFATRPGNQFICKKCVTNESKPSISSSMTTTKTTTTIIKSSTKPITNTTKLSTINKPMVNFLDDYASLTQPTPTPSTSKSSTSKSTPTPSTSKSSTTTTTPTPSTSKSTTTTTSSTNTKINTTKKPLNNSTSSKYTKPKPTK
jgi:hypothetical protein